VCVMPLALVEFLQPWLGEKTVSVVVEANTYPAYVLNP
jgi:hypothetical protein